LIGQSGSEKAIAGLCVVVEASGRMQEGDRRLFKARGAVQGKER
jgi:hypothetical protein